MKEGECLNKYQNEISRAKQMEQESNDPNEKLRDFKMTELDAATNTV